MRLSWFSLMALNQWFMVIVGSIIFYPLRTIEFTLQIKGDHSSRVAASVILNNLNPIKN